MSEIKTTQLIDNLQQLACDIHDFILDDDNQGFILKFLTGVDIISKNHKISSLAILTLISEYFINYSWEVDSVNMIVLREFIKKLPQPYYHAAKIEHQKLTVEIIVRIKDLFLLKAQTTLKQQPNLANQKLKQALIDAFLRKKFHITDIEKTDNDF